MPFKDFTSELFTTSHADLYLMSQVIIRCTSGTRPSQPTEGWHIYETDTQQLLIYKSGAWVPEDYPGGRNNFVIKTSDESSSSTVNHVDSQLFINVAANSIYMFDAFLAVNSTISGTIFDLDFGIPSGASIRLCWNQPTTAQEGFIDKTTWSTGSLVTAGYVDSAVGMAHQPFGLLITGASSGSLNVVWRTTNGSATITVKANSLLRIRKVS